jgi:hypothetical protein
MAEEPETPVSGEVPEEPMNTFTQNDDGSWAVGN